jgi:hypothetical protein
VTEAHRGTILGADEFDLIVSVTILSMFVAPYMIASPNLRTAGAALVVDEENTIGDELAREVVNALKRTTREAPGCALAGEKP